MKPKKGRSDKKFQLSPDIRKRLTKRFPDTMVFDEPMSRHTSFRIGGPADIWAAPKTVDDLKRLLANFTGMEIPFMVIGKGTNLLVSESGIRGAAVSLSRLSGVIEKRDIGPGLAIVAAPSGMRLASLCSFALSEGLAGMNQVLGVPGSVGGAVRMNAGTNLGDIGMATDSVDVLLPGGDLKTFDRRSIRPGYRRLDIIDGDRPIRLDRSPVIRARFRLASGDRDALRALARGIVLKRKASQPLGVRSAGCIFRNPSSDQPAGRLIDQLGLKGKSFGDAQISTVHANFIVNRGDASASDILKLIGMVKEAVYNAFGITLETEVQIVGETS